MNVIRNIKPSNLVHIKNQYEAINKDNDDYILNIYYLEENKIQILIRKINEYSGWNYNLKILIYIMMIKVVKYLILVVQQKIIKK